MHKRWWIIEVLTWLNRVLSWLTDQLISPAITGSFLFLWPVGTDWTGFSFFGPACNTSKGKYVSAQEILSLLWGDRLESGEYYESVWLLKLSLSGMPSG